MYSTTATLKCGIAETYQACLEGEADSEPGKVRNYLSVLDQRTGQTIISCRIHDTSGVRDRHETWSEWLRTLYWYLRAR